MSFVPELLPHPKNKEPFTSASALQRLYSQKRIVEGGYLALPGDEDEKQKYAEVYDLVVEKVKSLHSKAGIDLGDFDPGLLVVPNEEVDGYKRLHGGLRGFFEPEVGVPVVIPTDSLFKDIMMIHEEILHCAGRWVLMIAVDPQSDEEKVVVMKSVGGYNTKSLENEVRGGLLEEVVVHGIVDLFFSFSEDELVVDSAKEFVESIANENPEEYQKTIEEFGDDPLKLASEYYWVTKGEVYQTYSNICTMMLERAIDLDNIDEMEMMRLMVRARVHTREKWKLFRLLSQCFDKEIARDIFRAEAGNVEVAKQLRNKMGGFVSIEDEEW